MDNQVNDDAYTSEQKPSCNEDLVAGHVISVPQDLKEEPQVWDVEKDQLMSTKGPKKIWGCLAAKMLNKLQSPVIS